MLLRVLIFSVLPAAAQPSPELVELGKRLFSEKRLSADATVSCATCHEPQRGFADARTLSVGIRQRQGERHVPSLLARGQGRLQFWDGRAETLEKQVLEPIKNPKEMDLPVEQALRSVAADYPGLTEQKLAQALAAYVSTIRSENSGFDLFLRGTAGALSDLEREGLRLFRDKARCYICHSGNHFTDEVFHNTGVAWRGGKLLDEGRGAVSGKRFHKGAFKTPTLREIALTAPYMHDGSLARLEDVVEFYDGGGRANPYLDENIKPLHLTPDEKKALLAFLRALSGTVRDGM